MMKSFDCCVNENFYDGLLKVISRRNVASEHRDLSTLEEARMAEEMFRKPYDAEEDEDLDFAGKGWE